MSAFRICVSNIQKYIPSSSSLNWLSPALHLHLLPGSPAFDEVADVDNESLCFDLILAEQDNERWTGDNMLRVSHGSVLSSTVITNNLPASSQSSITNITQLRTIKTAVRAGSVSMNCCSWCHQFSWRSEEAIYEFWCWGTSCPISPSLYLQYSPPTLQLSITSLLIRNDETISLQCPDFFQWIKLPSYNIDFQQQHTSFNMELHSPSFVNLFQIKSSLSLKTILLPV